MNYLKEIVNYQVKKTMKSNKLIEISLNLDNNEFKMLNHQICAIRI